MTRKIVSLGLSGVALGVVLLGAAPARAQQYYGQQQYYEAGKVSVSAERLFGFHYMHETFNPNGPGPNNSDSGTSIGIGWQGAISPLQWARGGVDGFIINRLSLGGSLGFFSQSGDFGGNGVLFSPRVGWVVPISRVFSFWPRGGFTFLKMNDASLFALSGEAMFVASPRPGWGILFGPTLDFGFAGSQPNNVSWTHFVFGIVDVGLMATF